VRWFSFVLPYTDAASSRTTSLERTITQDHLLGARDPSYSLLDVMSRGSPRGQGVCFSYAQGGPGPAVGQVLRELLERVIEDPSLNTRDRLMPIVEQLAPELEKQVSDVPACGDRDREPRQPERRTPRSPTRSQGCCLGLSPTLRRPLNALSQGANLF